ncbi:helix-turn-helix transcriptional regulator [Sphingomonas bacterium]|uniref:helix-turn-helix transcriptional regulator n=1 Tax=Sphingomonas bacterium TaxID=1895847 RepID=UPI001575AF7D|nr:helix-turn-helix transcriptional regulator [Sphingomonas bacterium]
MRESMARDFANPNLSMGDVAAGVGLSERAGYLAFEAAGLGFTQELQTLRLDQAREYLLGSSLRVIDIAFAVGFSDASHFYRLFRRRFKCSPVEARATQAWSRLGAA